MKTSIEHDPGCKALTSAVTDFLPRHLNCDCGETYIVGEIIKQAVIEARRLAAQRGIDPPPVRDL